MGFIVQLICTEVLLLSALMTANLECFGAPSQKFNKQLINRQPDASALEKTIQVMVTRLNASYPTTVTIRGDSCLVLTYRPPGTSEREMSKLVLRISKYIAQTTGYSIHVCEFRLFDSANRDSYWKCIPNVTAISLFDENKHNLTEHALGALVWQHEAASGSKLPSQSMQLLVPLKQDLDWLKRQGVDTTPYLLDLSSIERALRAGDQFSAGRVHQLQRRVTELKSYLGTPVGSRTSKQQKTDYSSPPITSAKLSYQNASDAEKLASLKFTAAQQAPVRNSSISQIQEANQQQWQLKVDNARQAWQRARDYKEWAYNNMLRQSQSSR